MPHLDMNWLPDAALVAGEPLNRDDLPDAWADADGPVAQCRVVLWVWRHDPAAAVLSTDRMAELAARWATRLDATGVATLGAATAADAAAFLRAPVRRGGPPSVHTMHLRRTTLRAIYRTVHRFDPNCHDPSTFVELPARATPPARPLTDPELNQLRIAIMSRRVDPTPAALLLALAETGASTSELTRLRWMEIGARSVALPGGRRQLARVGRLTNWGVPIVALARAPDCELLSLAVSGSAAPPGSQPAIAAMTNRLRRLVDLIDSHGDERLGPRSIRLWAAATAYQRDGRIDAAAHVLGIRSLDAAAAALDI